MCDPLIYTVGWICALSVEQVAALEMLDEEHGQPEYVEPNDINNYKLGRIGKHNVVVATLPDGEYGLSSAATVARDLVHSFRNVRIGLLVGIAGGAPTSKNDVRLGDVVVSSPKPNSSGVYQYDFGKTVQDKKFHQTGVLNLPPASLRAAVGSLQTEYERRGHKLKRTIAKVLKRNPRLKKKYKRPSHDYLYRSDHLHVDAVDGEEQGCPATCGEGSEILVHRDPRAEDEDDPKIHHGVIASANQLMKDALIRDTLAKQMNVLCFEMEAAGLMNHFPCLVIRGVCDYSDSHKSKDWQGYAALTAASYAKDLFSHIHPQRVEAERKLVDVLGTIQQDLQTITQATKSEKYDAICNWLSSGSDYEKQLSDVEPSIAPGTGTWFVEHPIYCRWKDGDLRTMICPGVAGSGKTCLAARAIKDLLENQTTDGKVGVIYYFCRFQLRAQDMPVTFLSSILTQLGRWARPFPQSLEEIYDKLSPYNRRPTEEDLFSALMQIAKSFSAIYLVIDALDEFHDVAPRGVGLTNIISDFQQKCDRVKVLMTSRPEAELLVKFRSAIETYEELEIRATESDVGSYLRPLISRIGCLQNEGELVDRTVKGVIAAADGMFLLARLLYENLADSNHILDIEDKLMRLRTTSNALEEAYRATIERIESQTPRKREIAKLVLLWVFKAKRLMTSTELQIALALEDDDEVVDKRKFMRVELMVSLCAGLVTYQVENDLVVFSHRTVAEYMREARLPWTVDQDYQLSNTCTKYLCLMNLDSGVLKDVEKIPDAVYHFPFFDYAARFGGEHAFYAHRNRFYMPLRTALENPAVAVAVKETLQPSLWLGPEWTPYVLKMSVLAYFGIDIELSSLLEEREACHKASTEDTQTLLSSSKSSDQEFAHCRQASYADTFNSIEQMLSNASKFGRVSTVNIILAHNSRMKEINVTCQVSLRRAVSFAIIGGYNEMLRLLFDNGAEVARDDADIFYDDALGHACINGYTETIQLLLDHGLNTRIGTTVREDSSSRLARFLSIEYMCGASLPLKSESRGSMLQTASQGTGCEELVKLLLDRSADPNALSGTMPHALVSASTMGSKTTVEALLVGGAHVDAARVEGQTALQAASNKGFHDIVKILIDHGAAVNFCAQHQSKEPIMYHRYYHASSQSYSSNEPPLHLAALSGSIETVKALLKAGADVNAEGFVKQTPILAAALAGKFEVVRLLKKHGADSHRVDQLDRSVLHYLAAKSSADSIQWALTQGISVNVLDTIHWTPLYWAAYFGNSDTIKVLLEHGAEQLLPRPGVGDQYNHEMSMDETYEDAFRAALYAKDATAAKLLGYPDVERDGEYNPVPTCCSFCSHPVYMWTLYICKTCNECALCYRCGGHFRTFYQDRHTFTFSTAPWDAYDSSSLYEYHHHIVDDGLFDGELSNDDRTDSELTNSNPGSSEFDEDEYSDSGSGDHGSSDSRSSSSSTYRPAKRSRNY